MTDIDVYTLQEACRQAWTRETSASPDRWTEERPSIGQCAVTALVVQDYLGGDLLRVTQDGEGHYFNSLPQPGLDVDFTYDQFDDWNPSETETRTRDYVLSFPDTVKRYEILAERVRAILVP